MSHDVVAYGAHGHSASLRRTPIRSGVEVAPASGRTGWVSYRTDDLVRAELTLVADRRPRPTLQVTTDSAHWRIVIPAVSRNSDGTWTARISGLDSIERIRLRWTASDRFTLSRVSLTGSTSVPTSTPGRFALTTPAPSATGVSTRTPLTWQAG